MPAQTKAEIGKQDACGVGKLDEICLPNNTLLWDLLQDHRAVSFHNIKFLNNLFVFNLHFASATEFNNFFPFLEFIVG